MSEYNVNYERIRWTAENTLRLCDEVKRLREQVEEWKGYNNKNILRAEDLAEKNQSLRAENQRLREQIHREGWNDLLQERDSLRQQVEELQMEPKVEKAVWQHAEVEAVIAERDRLQAELVGVVSDLFRLKAAVEKAQDERNLARNNEMKLEAAVERVREKIRLGEYGGEIAVSIADLEKALEGVGVSDDPRLGTPKL